MSNPTVTFLRNFNRWRRGDDSIQQPQPGAASKAIDDACEQIEELERDRNRIVKQDAETFLLAFKYKRALDMIAEDCEAWLNSESDEPSIDFIKAIRKHAQEVTQ